MLVNSMQGCVLVNSMQDMYAGEQYARVASCHIQHLTLIVIQSMGTFFSRQHRARV